MFLDFKNLNCTCVFAFQNLNCICVSGSGNTPCLVVSDIQKTHQFPIRTSLRNIVGNNLFRSSFIIIKPKETSFFIVYIHIYIHVYIYRSHTIDHVCAVNTIMFTKYIIIVHEVYGLIFDVRVVIILSPHL